MATKGLLNDSTELDIFNCTICLCRFRTPKCLPCLHTFCQPCLNTYIMSSKRADTKAPPTSFSCPICRSEVKPPQESSPIEEWAELMPLNHTIFSLMDNLEPPKQPSENNCDLCMRDDEISKAEFRCINCRENLCETCKKCHKRHKAYINHKIVLIAELNPEDVEVGEVEEPCAEHKGEMMKVYCVDHGKMCCVVCLSVNHRRCDNIKTFDEMAENMEKNKEVQQLTKKIDDMGSKTETLLIKKKENIDDIDKQHKDILAKTSTIVEEAKRKLDNCFGQFKKQVALVQKENSTKLVDTKERLENFQKFLSYCDKTLKAVTKYGSSKQTFVTLEKIKFSLDLQGKELEEFLKDDKNISYKVVVNQHLAALNTKMDSIAEVEIQCTPLDKSVVFTTENPSDGIGELQRELKSADISKLEAVQIWDINTGGFIAGGFFMDDGNLMCANKDTKSISMYDSRGKLLVTHPLGFEPWGICQSPDGSIYVSDTTFFYWKIRVFRITNKSFTEVKQIKIPHIPRALNIIEGKILVQFDIYHSRSIHSIPLNGRNHDHTKICPSCHGTGIAVSTSGGRPRFYFCKDKTLVWRSMDDRDEIRHKLQLHEPRGVALDAADNIYVCSEESNTIFVVSKDGSSSRVFMSGTEKIFKPFGIGFDKSGTKFFVSCSRTNNLVVYNLSLKD